MAKAWYIVHTYSGYEQKIQRTIFKLREMDTDFALVVSDVKVPMETVTEIKDGKKKEVKRKILPGYILVEIDFPDDATWKNTYSKIKRIQGVTGFVSAMEGRKPQPLTAAEMKGIMQKTGEVPTEKEFRPKQNFQVGEEVKIIDGPFESFSGTIDEIDTVKGKLRVSVQIFGRSTPVEVEFNQAEKVEF
ncbi:MAG: transcription termination/antitermination factor NusG [Spirochaetes bacterium]|uniref:Transcription termination/antitermination protein NusG n=1 Tax=Candidatus Aphodenecus pullistercoris TaxID=2840669 RepID=A0A9D9E6P9_9SPIR|nr:transcription termination/antitermination factor NusG [Candidatus Aphodenecus pullistercoris]